MSKGIELYRLVVEVQVDTGMDKSTRNELNRTMQNTGVERAITCNKTRSLVSPCRLLLRTFRDWKSKSTARLGCSTPKRMHGRTQNLKHGGCTRNKYRYVPVRPLRDRILSLIGSVVYYKPPPTVATDPHHPRTLYGTVQQYRYTRDPADRRALPSISVAEHCYITITCLIDQDNGPFSFMLSCTQNSSRSLLQDNMIKTMTQASDSHSQHQSNNVVAILAPQHVSAVPPIDASTRFLRVYTSPGVIWRGLFPLLMDAPPRICRRLLRILYTSSPKTSYSKTDSFCNTLRSSSEKDEEGLEQDENNKNDPPPGFWHRTIRIKNVPKITLILQPPTISHLDPIFAAVILKTEHSMLRLQTLTAWLSTLGGGYFFCKRLNVSLQMARQQRMLALKIGNISMARQCSVNEAYNLIYAGRFQEGKRVLKELEDSIRSASRRGDKEDGSVTLRQCEAARLLAKRLKQVSKRGLKGYHTNEKGEKHAIDDYQRIRIVED